MRDHKMRDEQRLGIAKEKGKTERWLLAPTQVGHFGITNVQEEIFPLFGIFDLKSSLSLGSYVESLGVWIVWYFV